MPREYISRCQKEHSQKLVRRWLFFFNFVMFPQTRNKAKLSLAISVRLTTITSSIKLCYVIYPLPAVTQLPRIKTFSTLHVILLSTALVFLNGIDIHTAANLDYHHLEIKLPLRNTNLSKALKLITW